MNAFLKGTFVLASAAFLGELVEFLVNMILARELGKEGMGIYMSVLPIIFLIATVASLEFPISIAKFIAEHDRKEHRHMMKHATRFALFMTVIFFCLTAVVVFSFPVLSHYHPMLNRIVLIFIPIVAFSAILRGYFTGKNRMTTIAVSNFIRKAVQLTLLFLLFRTFSFESAELSMLAAVGALVGTEAVILIYFFFSYFTSLNVITKSHRPTLQPKEIRHKLLAVSLPTTGLRLFNSLANAIQPFLIKKALVLSGMSISVATQHFGILMGVAATIGFFPAFFAHSILVALIPAVSEAQIKQDSAKLQELLQQCMKMTFTYGIPSVVVMYVFAHPLTNLFFHSTEAVYYLQNLWPFFLFHYFSIPLQAYLIGLGLVKDGLYHTIWAHIISFGMIYLLGSQQEIGMHGIIMGLNAGAVLLMLLHYVTVCRAIGVTLILWRTKKT
ncbi:polysaccharide biosynthesis protein [Priestia koreensis]|uniref:polysaccharide biosynthesis protein n=1 Tax=Priestia koreensis TaxID=284581 RepID=UPI003CFBFBA3